LWRGTGSSSAPSPASATGSSSPKRTSTSSQSTTWPTRAYSHIERQLPDLRGASAYLSFDFSSDWTREYLAENLPQVEVAFLSNPSQTLAESEGLLSWAKGLGPEMVIITCGREGSIAHDGERVWRQGIVETRVVDTLGAGDAFAARFLVEHLSGSHVGEAMEEAARSAAETCGYYGAFGHGAPIGNDHTDKKSQRKE
jgi:fructoselysine 6-kinase